jgi:hypothetical protein
MASGNSLLSWEPQAGVGPASNYATLETRNSTDPHYIAYFDQTTDEELNFKGVMPQHYAGTTGVTLYIHYLTKTAIAGNVVWQAAFERVSDSIQDIDSSGFAALNGSGAITVPGTSGLVDITTIAFTDGADMDSVAAGDGFRLKLRRDADDTSATDSLADDAGLWLLELRET